MVQGRILFSACALPMIAAGTRVDHKRQSIAAVSMASWLGRLLPAKQVCSVAHSRHAVAAAVGLGESIRLGIDIEWIDGGRDTRGLMQFLLPSRKQEEADSFYFVWTFSEAYYKAFQLWPGAELLAQAAAHPLSQPLLKFPDGTVTHQQRFLDGFQLSVTWRADDGPLITPHFVSPPENLFLTANRERGSGNNSGDDIIL